MPWPSRSVVGELVTEVASPSPCREPPGSSPEMGLSGGGVFSGGGDAEGVLMLIDWRYVACAGLFGVTLWLRDWHGFGSPGS